MKNHTSEWDLVIAGAGPGGLAAGIYAGRSGLKVVVLENSAPGGKVIKTDEIENYPGFKTIKGFELASNFIEQAIEQNCEFIYSGIIEFDKMEDYFYVSLNNGDILKTKTLLIATGTKENKLGIPGEDELYGKGVSYCAVCDAAFHKEKEVVVVGGGYSALEEAIYLTKFASKVYLVHRREEFRADDKILKQAQDNKKIIFVLNSIVTKVNGNEKVESVEIKNLIDNSSTLKECSAIFPFIGAKPVTGFVNKKEILDSNNYIVTNEKMETCIKGLYAAGDVRVTPLRQVVTATSDGAIAAQNAVNYIQKNH